MGKIEDPQHDGGLTRMVVVGALGAMIAAQLSHVILGEAGFFSGALFFDADVYMWFNRVEALVEGRGWFDHVEPRVFPPEGHVQHWTRPVDILLLAGAYFLSLFFEFREALALWGNLFSPVMLVAAGWLMYRLAGVLVGRREAIVAASVFVLYPSVLGMFAWSRADHHSLLGLGQVAFFLGLLSFFLSEEHRDRKAFVTGLIGAAAIWVNVEALGYVLVGLSFLGLWWLFGRRDLVRANIAMSGGLFAGITAAVLIERGPEFFAAYPIDTMGFPYVVLFALTWLFWVGLGAWTKFGAGRGGVAGRICVAAGLVAAVLGAIAVFAPTFFAGPFVHVDELYREVRLQNLAEQLPVFAIGVHPPLVIIGRVLLYFGIVIVGLFGIAQKLGSGLSRRERWAWAMMGLMAVGFAALSLDAVRWTLYIPLGAAPGFGLVAGRFLDWIGRVRRGDEGSFIKQNLLRPVAVTAVLIGIPVVGAGAEKLGERIAAGERTVEADEVDATPMSCDLRDAAQVVDTIDGVDEAPLVAMTPDRTAEWIYRTGHSVTALANHRKQPGFTLYFEAMSHRNIEQAHAMLAESGVDLVMVCGGEVWVTLRRGGESVIERLVTGDHGEEFEKLAGPDEAGGWWIYGV